MAETAVSNRTIDLRPQNMFGITVQATIVVEGTRQIEIADRRYNTIQIRELASVELLDWEFENLFWVDTETGFVWKSVQYITPELPPIEMEILKPAS
ncbi:MAG: YjbF family lipoprotein [Verrucomicrobia bacterium]|nr:YjbF family lipoprotein [Verrucomicrobiota bacterium]